MLNWFNQVSIFVRCSWSCVTICESVSSAKVAVVIFDAVGKSAVYKRYINGYNIRYEE